MYVIAHIGNIPVEEWVPFLVPVLALYFWGRRSNRRRAQAVNRLPRASEGLDTDTTARVLAHWEQAKHTKLSAEYVPLLYPPGPQGMTAGELAERIAADPATVELQLEALEDLGYLELRSSAETPPRAWLTITGYELLEETEAALLSASAS